MRILSCGAGMDSMALALMSCENKLCGTVHKCVPIYDAIVFVNLGSEPCWVETQVEFIRGACEYAKIPFIEIDNNLYEDYLIKFGRGHVSDIPFWSVNDEGKKAKMHRHYTIDFKINEVEKYLKYELLGYKKYQRLKPEDILAHEMHIGFSYEEQRRIKGKEYSKLFVKKYPLVDMGWTRSDSYGYILERWELETKASACCFCPFHTNYFFNYLKTYDYKNYLKLVVFDEMIGRRQPDTKIRSKLFVSKALKRIEDLQPEDCTDAQYFEYKGQKIWNGF